ncbi:MAG TPA: CBS domain-containing protein [Candidatus Limnocylindria bacterium]|nr:CBS domain-containing protein [Candidatus Limnocylindria bacterium]
MSLQRIKNLCVADLMTIDPIVIGPKASVSEAEELMAAKGVSGLPVVDDHGRLIGVISQTDLLYLTRPAVRALMTRWETPLTVAEVMTSPPVTVRTTISLENAARVMSEHDVHRVVAVDRKGRPVGVLSASDFVQLAAIGC